MEPETNIIICIAGENLYIKPQTETVWQGGSIPGFYPLGIPRDFWVLGWEENEGGRKLPGVGSYRPILGDVLWTRDHWEERGYHIACFPCPTYFFSFHNPEERSS